MFLHKGIVLKKRWNEPDIINFVQFDYFPIINIMLSNKLIGSPLLPILLDNMIPCRTWRVTNCPEGI
jgi:hypothetical protein